MTTLYEDLVESLTLAKDHLDGKITLKTYTVEMPDAPELSPADIRAIRERLKLSQAVFARSLRTSVRTYQNWEQGKTKPNAQAALLLKMVDKSPQTFADIAQL